jgi:hypothetical protein
MFRQGVGERKMAGERKIAGRDRDYVSLAPRLSKDSALGISST